MMAKKNKMPKKEQKTRKKWMTNKILTKIEEIKHTKKKPCQIIINVEKEIFRM